MSIHILGWLQFLIALPKFWLAYRQPKRRAWHLISGSVILALAVVMINQRF